jgi:hypothetical protein
MMPRTRNSHSVRPENLRDGILLAVEILAWLTAWIVLPAILGSRGTTMPNFAGYALAAGTLLAAGMLADRGGAFEDFDHFLWFASLSSLAILLLGGAVFGLSHLLLWGAAQ